MGTKVRLKSNFEEDFPCFSLGNDTQKRGHDCKTY